MGVPAARGHGVMEVQTSGAFNLECTVIVTAGVAGVDSPKGSISPGTKVPSMRFAGCSLRRRGLPMRRASDTLGDSI